MVAKPPRPGKIVCVGRNYAAHARELGHEVPAEPLLFFKPPSAIIPAGGEIVVPAGVGRVDFEGEVAFVVGTRARSVPREEGWGVLSHLAAANDVTARDLQRTDGQWTRAKGFDTFLPLGEPVALEGVDRDALELRTLVNGELRQLGRIGEMIFDPPTLVSFISGIMTLEPGDLILTGTPEGVGPLAPGDEVQVRIEGAPPLRNRVVAGARDG